MKKVNILIFALSLVIATVLWGYVVFYINPPGEKTVDGIQVDFINESALTGRGLILTGGRNATVAVRFSGRIQDYARVNRDSVKAVIDLRNISTAGSIPVAYELQGLPELEDLDYYAITPIVTITVDRLIGKPVRLRLDLANDALAEGHGYDPAEFNPFQLNITGPANVLDTVFEAVVRYGPAEPISRSVKDLRLGYTFYTESGEIVESELIGADYDEVWLTLNVYREKTVPLKVDYIDGGGLTGKNIIIKIEPDSVRVAGDPNTLDTLNDISVLQIDLADLEGNLSESYTIHYPPDIRNLDYEDKALVSIEITGVTTKEISTMNIQINEPEIPEGYTYTFVTSPITVTLRGPADDLNRVVANNVRVVADFSEETVIAGGRYGQPGTVSVDGFESVGAINKGYEVVIEIVPLGDSP
jgi:YbbR domain-containing protein